MKNKTEDQINYQKESSVYWVILGCSSSDLSLLDFSQLNIKCYHINSEDLKEVIVKMDNSGRNLNLLNDIQKEYWDSERLYVLTPLDYSKPVEEEKFWYLWEILLLIYPSDIYIHSDIHFQFFDNKLLYWTGQGIYNFHPTDHYNFYSNFLYFDESKLEEINKFINLFIDRFPNIKYINSALNSYTSSFGLRQKSMSFLSLCISLEAIVSAHQELSYRIKRNVAILVGRADWESMIIFKNISKIYNLRSKIVHSGDYNPDKFAEYIPYLRCLVSRLIIEVILHNINDLKKLNETLTAVGFGDYKKISEGYEECKINLRSYMETVSTILN